MKEKGPTVIVINCGINWKTCNPRSKVKLFISPVFGRNLAAGFNPDGRPQW